jgi:hypothetical protein
VRGNSYAGARGAAAFGEYAPGPGEGLGGASLRFGPIVRPDGHSKVAGLYAGAGETGIGMKSWIPSSGDIVRGGQPGMPEGGG